MKNTLIKLNDDTVISISISKKNNVEILIPSDTNLELTTIAKKDSYTIIKLTQ